MPAFGTPATNKLGTRAVSERVIALGRYLGTVAAGRPLHGAERHRPFFIVGSGRCGTTLMRAMLEAHPTIHIPPGNVLLRLTIQEYRRCDRLPWAVLLRLLLGNMAFHPSWDSFDLPLGPVYRELVERPPRARDLAAVLNALYRAHMARHKPGAARWGDKSPFGVLALDDLRAVFPDLRVVHMLRDGRDVAASFRDAFGGDIARSAMVWLRAVRAAHAFRDRLPGQYLEMRYEDLVGRPEPSLRRVAAFLDLPFEERMLHHHEADLRLGDVERTPYMQGAKQAVHQTSVGRWRRTFSAEEVAELERRLNPTLAALGYGA